MTTVDELRKWIEHPRENEHLEFKEARLSYSDEKLADYCLAIANEGGGKFILGITDQRPRKVVGTKAFENIEKVKHELLNRLRLRVDVEELLHPDGRVLVFHVPSRPVGMPLQKADGRYLMRSGQSLVAMAPDHLRRIFDEAGPDYSAEVCTNAALTDLDNRAIKAFRELWRKKSSNLALDDLDNERLLRDAELVVDRGVTYAALVLLGTQAAVGRYLAQAEVIFEYRSTPNAIEYQQRKEFREGFLLFFDAVWQTIDLRNDVQHFQEGLLIRDIPTFTESVVREALLNAISHRDYRLAGSVFIRQFPRTIEIVSPGGFPAGVSAENILFRQSPRNRRLAEALSRCGLVERSGQGADKMFQDSIRQGKAEPDFRGTDAHQVSVTLSGEVQDPRFLRFLEKISMERQKSFSTMDLVVLDRVSRDLALWPAFKQRLPVLVEEGLLERVGRRYILSHRFQKFLGRKGEYSRKRGLGADAQKTLLLEHIVRSGSEGCQFREFQQVVPNLSRDQLQTRLKELKAEGRAHTVGVTKNARWFQGPKPEIASKEPHDPQS